MFVISFGGLGFCDFTGFNLALLGKQGWNLMTNQDTITSRIIKARYFPRRDFLEAPLGHNPSFIWRSIWPTQSLLRDGYRWRIGSGENINIWTEPWLRFESNLRPTTPMQIHYQNWRVRNLILSEQNSWNAALLNEVFNAQDVAHILQIPLHHLNSMDRRIWRFTKTGTYTVKSAYRLYIDNFTQSNSLHNTSDWSFLWQLNVPRKCRTFLWRLCHNVLPTRSRLQQRGVNCPSLCAICLSSPENNWHLMLTCPLAISVWTSLNWWHNIEPKLVQYEDFCSFFFEFTKTLTQSDQCLFGMCLWSIWKERNDFIWSNKPCDAPSIILRAQSVLRDFNWANKHIQQNANSTNHDDVVKWSKPTSGYFKCNIDTAFFSQYNSVGFGAVIRDSLGSFQLAR